MPIISVIPVISNITVYRYYLVVVFRVVEVWAQSTFGHQVTEVITTTVTVTATRLVCGPYQSTRPLMTDRLPATTKAARRLLLPPLVTARADTRTPEWYSLFFFSGAFGILGPPYISETVEARNFKFGTEMDSSEY